MFLQVVFTKDEKTHSEFDPFVHMSLLVELEEEATASDDKRTPLHLTLPTAHTAKRVVLVVTQQPSAALQRHCLVDLQDETSFMYHGVKNCCF